MPESRAAIAHRSLMTLIPIDRVRYLAGLWLVGTGALAFATWICFQAGLNATTTAPVYLIIVVALSWFDSFVSSALFSVTAVGCLNYFFGSSWSRVGESGVLKVAQSCAWRRDSAFRL